MLCRIYNKKGSVEKQPSSVPKIESSEMIEDKKPEIMTRGSALPAPVTDYLYFDTSDSVPKLHTTDSSCSEQVVSPEFAGEVQSEPKWSQWEDKSSLEFPYNYVDATGSFGPQLQSGNQMSPLQDIFMYLQKPF